MCTLFIVSLGPHLVTLAFAFTFAFVSFVFPIVFSAGWEGLGNLREAHRDGPVERLFDEARGKHHSNGFERESSEAPRCVAPSLFRSKAA